MSAKKVKAEAYERRVVVGEYAMESVPLWSLPRTTASYDKMVEQGARGIIGLRLNIWRQMGDEIKNKYHAKARAALAAIGITRPKETKL